MISRNYGWKKKSPEKKSYPVPVVELLDITKKTTAEDMEEDSEPKTPI